MVKYTFLIITLFALTACQSTGKLEESSVTVNKSLLNDDYFLGYQDIKIETESDVFELNDAMRNFVNAELLPEKEHRKRARKLLEHIFETNQINISYSSTANLTAIQAYQSKEANCMSLTILAYALAKSANLNVRFQDVQIPEYWVRNGNYNMRTGHINLVLTRPREPSKVVLVEKALTEIDFDPYVVKKRFPKKIVDKATVLAMFYNNKGAQALVEGNHAKAYAYFKASVETAPSFSPSWGNLGILYRFIGDYDLSIESYRYALAINKNNLTTLSNFALLLNHLGEEAMAQQISDTLYKKRRRNPYYYALLADEALHSGEVKASISNYKKAIRLDDSEHEFFFGLAKAHYKDKNMDSAEAALKKAMAVSKSLKQDEKYLAKLNFLRAR